MIPDIKIGTHVLGQDHPVFVIAEAGVNHNGDPGMAAKLVREAKLAGANCVKFQTFKAERVVTANAPKASYQMKVTDPTQSQLSMLQALELSENAYGDLVALCAEEGLVFTSTPYNELLKSASIHLAEPRFLQRLAETGLPLVVSTGMATWAELNEAVDAIRSTGNEQFILLQCTTNYPSLVADTNLRAMVEMRQRYSCLTGYSDHTQSHAPCIGAVALGACVIEKHFTLDLTLPGPDHSTSEDMQGFAALVGAIHDIEAALGSCEKKPTKAEIANMPGMRRSIAARNLLLAGHQIGDNDLTCKRPASGIAPREWGNLLGRRIKRSVQAGDLLSWDDLDD